ncbi:branched-chain amino acid ABC transporter permease [Ilumatobacter nonamiensis]|uniref:branched-chain amino acid ABC transporter permease n=1 Tax=Ilumatobacter nonamiensis TaxID=467093 RepID=UPI0003480A89|nr:branched-chain amino acid ABC transporter permease [Ilumatobacter nonamiensis]
MDYQAIIESLFRGLIGERFIVFALAAIGLNLHFGYTGLLNFGQAVFMAAGAYGLAMTVVTIGPAVNRNTGLNMSESTLFWVGIFMAVVVFPLVLALLMGIPTLRLRADYLAIVTIAVAEIFRLIARSPSLDKWTGSSDGLTGFTSTFYDLSPFTTTDRYFFNLFTGNQFFLVLVGWSILALGTLLCWLMIKSPWGRVLKAIREDEDAARSLGKNAYSYKMQALILGGMFGAVGGMVRAVGFSVAQPDNFITDVTFFVYVALILGGAGKVFGPLVGAALLYAVLDSSDTILRQLVANDYIPESIMSGTQVGQVRFMLVGLGLILLAAFRPQGIFGNKEEMALDDR